MPPRSPDFDPLGPPPKQPDPDPFQDPIAVAMVEVVVEQGYAETSVEDVVERAGVTRAEFDRRFAGKEDCAQKIFEAFVGDYIWRLETAYRSQEDWRSSLRAAAYEVAEWITENPKLTRFGAVDILAAENEMIRVRRDEAFYYGASLIDRGRSEVADPASVTDTTAEMAIGSIVQLLTHHIQNGTELKPMGMVPQLMYLAVKPYVGEELAREELTAPRPPSPRLRSA